MSYNNFLHYDFPFGEPDEANEHDEDIRAFLPYWNNPDSWDNIRTTDQGANTIGETDEGFWYIKKAMIKAPFGVQFKVLSAYKENSENHWWQVEKHIIAMGETGVLEFYDTCILGLAPNDDINGGRPIFEWDAAQMDMVITNTKWDEKDEEHYEEATQEESPNCGSGLNFSEIEPIFSRIPLQNQYADGGESGGGEIINYNSGENEQDAKPVLIPSVHGQRAVNQATLEDMPQPTVYLTIEFEEIGTSSTGGGPWVSAAGGQPMYFNPGDIVLPIKGLIKTTPIQPFTPGGTM